jgi:hypothetical protein
MEQEHEDVLLAGGERLGGFHNRFRCPHARAGPTGDVTLAVGGRQQRLHHRHGAALQGAGRLGAVAGEHHQHPQIRDGLEGSAAEGEAIALGQLITADQQAWAVLAHAKQRLLLRGGDALDASALQNRMDDGRDPQVAFHRHHEAQAHATGDDPSGHHSGGWLEQMQAISEVQTSVRSRPNV